MRCTIDSRLVENKIFLPSSSEAFGIANSRSGSESTQLIFSIAQWLFSLSVDSSAHGS